MKIQDSLQTAIYSEIDLLLTELQLKDRRILELGCGRAEKTRAIAQTNLPAELVAMEVDLRQHEKNLAQEALPGVTFKLGGAEAIPFDDASFDLIMMFKSLHHVPLEYMDSALLEIRRVLKPGGMAWISEPVFAGDFNEIMRLFHDEKLVRESAFQAVRNAVEHGTFQLKKQLFFNVRNRFKNFNDFDVRMIQVTHSEHHLLPATYSKVREKFDSFMTPLGAEFLTPQRVDLLIKPL